MRMASWSRVMPALLTSTCNPPCSLTMASTSASTPVLSLTSRQTPRQPAKPPSACEMPDAPASVVAVPITLKPCSASVCAMARPMPREAPVTSATWPALISSTSMHSASDAGSASVSTCASASMRLTMPASTLPGPHSTTWLSPRARKACTTSTQRTGAEGLAVQRIADRIRIGLHRHVDVVDQRDARRGKGHVGQALAQGLGRRAHQRTMERRRHRQIAPPAWHPSP